LKSSSFSLLTMSSAEIFGSLDKESIKNPLTAAYLRIEKGPPVSPPQYDFDEAGVILEGGVLWATRCTVLAHAISQAR
jgi:hypothetical protein